MCIRIANDVVYHETEKRRPGFQQWVSFAYGVCTCDTINNKEKGIKKNKNPKQESVYTQLIWPTTLPNCPIDIPLHR